MAQQKFNNFIKSANYKQPKLKKKVPLEVANSATNKIQIPNPDNQRNSGINLYAPVGHREENIKTYFNQTSRLVIHLRLFIFN